LQLIRLRKDASRPENRVPKFGGRPVDKPILHYIFPSNGAANAACRRDEKMGTVFAGRTGFF
jgi:hypothetical protein